MKLKPSVETRRLLMHTGYVLSKKRTVTSSELQAHIQALAEYLRELIGEPEINVQVVMPKPPDEAAAAAVEPSPKSGAPAAAAVN